jgi:hypothetical protein
VHRAVDELYTSDPEQFVARRSALVTEARNSGDATAAKQIASLRKPSRSAWIVNRLVRSRPAVTSQLASLGDELRAAERSLDGAQIRELSMRRRGLIDALTREAFAVAGEESPPAGLRDEVIATLGAAVADPQVAEQLAEGTLVRAARWDGFGFGASPALTVVPSPPAVRAGKPASKATPKTRQAPAATRATAEEERRQAAIADANQAVIAAEQAVSAAAKDEQTRQEQVQQAEQQLFGARKLHAEARRKLRQAKDELRAAQQRMHRLGG